MKSTVIRCFACLTMLVLVAVCSRAQTEEQFAPPPTTCTPPGLYCVGGTVSTSPIRQNNVFVSLNSNQTILTNMLGTGNADNAHITGVVVTVPSGCESGCVSGGPYIDYGGATRGGIYCPSPNFSTLDSFVATVYGANTTNRKLTNIVVAPAGYNNNTETSVGVFSQGWANTLADCSGNALYSFSWAQGNYYLPGDYIKDSGGNYWQIRTGNANTNYTPTNASYSGGTATITVSQTPPSSLVNQFITVTLASPSSAPQYNVVEARVTGVSGNTLSYSLSPAPSFSGAVTAGDITGDARCVAGAAGGPTPTSSSPYKDGLGNNACTWTKLAGTNAPPQDAWVSTNYKGNQAYQISLNASASQTCTGGPTGKCTVTLANSYVGSVGDSVTVSTGTNLDCTNCAISAGGIGATTVTYSNPNKTYSGTATGTLTAQRVFNVNSVNGTIASAPNPVLASGLPTPYEPPMKTWIKYICGQVYAHYKSDTRVGYIRCGLSVGGEANTVGLTANPGWPFGSQSVFVSYYQDVMGYAGGLATSDSLVCMGNLNSFDLPEGQISISNSCGIGTNGYKVDDVVAASFNSQCLIIGDIQSDWCWNFNQYNSVTMPNGKHPILELQTSAQSTPGSDILGNTGGLSIDSVNCGSYCTWPGLPYVAKTYLANDGEWYMCDFMLAYDSNYPDGCTGGYSKSTYSGPYKLAFAAFAP